MWKTALTAILAITTTACLGSDFADSVAGSWQMTSGSVDGEVIPVLDSHPITITFEEGQVGGTASCNGYGGAYELDGSSITFHDLAMTEMACSPEETMQAEAMFADAIGRVDTVAINEQLTLAGDGVDLRFEALQPAPESELTNRVWVLDGLVKEETVTSPVEGSRATIEFFTDGSTLGDTGCRLFSGRYTVSGAEVVMADLAADGHECEPDMAEQDGRFLTVIEGTFRVEVEGDQLTIWTRGDEGLTFVAES